MLRKYVRNCKRRSRCYLVWLLFICLLMPQFSAADEGIPLAPGRDQMVRVHLTRMALEDRLDVTLLSPYLLTTELGTQAVFEEGSELTLLLRNNSIYVHHGNIAFSAGSEILLQRTGANDNGEAGFIRTNFPAQYMGDLKLDAVEGRMRPILSIHVEDYLLGVVPHEMSESFPVEALKAQAVAARTYALKSQAPKEAYDVVDTTNDQVYKGYLPGNPNVEKAVAETKGVCGFYHEQLAQCYYSASNGGQMELVESVWPTQEDFGYYTFGEDPYDVANPESVVKRFEMAKSYTQEAPLALRQLVAQQLKDQPYDPDCIRIDSISDVKVLSPVKPSSKLMTKLQLRMSISTREKHEMLPVVDLDTEEVNLFMVEEIYAPAATQTPASTAEPRFAYGSFVPMEEELVLELAIFPTAEDAFGLDISSNYDNEIWTVAETDEAFVLEARRYGHGVGMSQRGAQWMAEKHQMKYSDILGFYYPKMKLMQYPSQPVSYAQPAEALVEDAGPAATPTPRPTLMPVTDSPKEGQWFATVTEISENSSLNLRKEPNLSADILMRIYKNQRLLVVERCPEEGWVKVRTDVIEGYVMESYLTRE